MGLLSNLRDFGSTVYSGISAVISPIVTATTDTSVTSSLSSGINTIIDSVFSRISGAISPPPDATTQTTSQKVGGAPAPSTMGSGSYVGLLIVAALIGFLIFKRR